MTPTGASVPFTITREDILRSKVLDPGWYKALVKKVWQEGAKDGESTNTWIEFTIQDGPTQKDGSDPKETPCRRCFSEKAPGFAIPYLVAAGANVTQAGGNFDLAKSTGKQMLIYVENRMWEGKLQNDVKDFKAITAV